MSMSVMHMVTFEAPKDPSNARFRVEIVTGNRRGCYTMLMSEDPTVILGSRNCKWVTFKWPQQGESRTFPTSLIEEIKVTEIKR